MPLFPAAARFAEIVVGIEDLGGALGLVFTRCAGAGGVMA
jgi:hypothetical protein